ncbi:MAG: hypothetical protein A2W35_11185 [Chloroflexi bacterium RBG_16_57_11]|nr:MAG: hypothetical protein A2W35_11185 [Chloroflexi bacterium RBG_16_57_11]
MSDQIATYTFLPWLRQGIVSKVKNEDTLGEKAGPVERTSVLVSLTVNGQKNFVTQNVQLIGPGDVIGVSPRAVVRTEPRHWITDFEPNYLAFVEFYEEDFPWRFTPARAVRQNLAGNPASSPKQTKLRPWIFLLALEESEFEEISSLSQPLASIRLVETTDVDAVLPPSDESWAWAHVHVSQDVTAGGANSGEQSVDALENLLRQNRDNALSRLICPRKLKPLKAYHAFLIPAFEVGRLAGLGQPTAGKDALAPSWGAGQREYPVYYRWYFRTGERGDFEYLVGLLEMREADQRVGIRDMDMQTPNFGVVGMGAGLGDLPVMGLEGALKSLKAVPRPKVWPPKDPDPPPAFLTDLENIVNLQETLLHLTNPNAAHPDPIICPPLYGRWHAPQDRLDVSKGGWVNQLNRDPRLRVPAGFGTKVVQTGQEGYMQRAWQQLGDILRANQKIRQVQVSIASSMRVYTRHFANLDADQKVAVTQQVHRRVLGGVETVSQQLKASRLEPAAVSSTFREVFRPRGALMRKAIPGNPGKPTDVLLKLNEGEVTAAPPKKTPQGQISLSVFADRLPDKRLREDRLTADVVDRIPVRPAFRFTAPSKTRPTPFIDAGRPGDSPEGGNMRAALGDLHARFEIQQPPPGPRPRIDVETVGETLAGALNPKTAILQRALSTIFIPETFNFLRPKETIVTVMAHPEFPDPMYKPLRDLSSELLVPNLNLIPNNSVTLLAINQKFIEAYLVGLNHEMARELLWREFPTDQRGSYFRQFWDVSEVVNRDLDRDPKLVEEALRDIKHLHEWGRNTPLGEHGNRPLPAPGDDRLVLVIRGDLLKRYPTAVIFAQKAKWEFDPDLSAKVRVLDRGAPQDTVRDPIFKAEIEPDLHFLGFDLIAKIAKGDPNPPPDGGLGDPGWFFVIQERPGEPRFGLDLVTGTPEREVNELQNWNQLSWNHFGNPGEVPLIRLDLTPISNIPKVVGPEPDKAVVWGANAADMAYILFQVPVMVAIHADELLP